MRSVGELSSYILGSLKDEEAGRVALYHYLKNFCEFENFITPKLINSFLAEALQLPHWQEKRVDLQTDIHELLQRFFSQTGTPFSLDQVWDVSRMQLILLTQCENLYSTVKHYEQSLLKEGEGFRLLPDGELRIVVIKRFGQGEILVRTYNNLVRMEGHILIPLCPEQEIFYNSSLELMNDRVQKLRPAPHSKVQFVLKEGEVQAQFTSGFAFRQNQNLKLVSLAQEPRIFWPLKRLERYYVYRPSDPYYVELMSGLSRAIQMLQSREPEAMSFARTTFESGQIAFDQIFPDDKGLYANLRELARQISFKTKEVSFERSSISPTP